MDKVYCPWCGKNIGVRYCDEEGNFQFHVDESSKNTGLYFRLYHPEGTRCPIGTDSTEFIGSSIYESEEEAYAAIRRPLQKPMTLEEAMDRKEPGVCVEHKVPRCIYYAFVSDSEFEGMCNIESIGRSTPCIARIADYGKEWRCWATKPSDEEREAAKWE